MSFEIKGKLVEKFDEVQVTEKFKKREFVLEVSPDNPDLTFVDLIKFQLTQDKCNLVESIAIGSDLTVFFNVRGRKWEKDTKVGYFVSLDAWKLDGVSNFEDAPQANDPTSETPPLPSEEDDLPF